MKRKFLICKHCGNLVEMIEDSSVNITCCGEVMEEIVANTTEAATEKHIPVYTENENEVTITVGETIHPMEENHYIKWIHLETNKGNYHFNLKPGMEPMIKFKKDENETILKIYAYCNLHGLWKNEK